MNLRSVLTLAFICLLGSLSAWSQDSKDVAAIEDRLEASLNKTIDKAEAKSAQTPVLVLGMGDSLTHGTMDGTNNYINTNHGYLQLVVDKLAQVNPVVFEQPLFDISQNRIDTTITPTNLSVDGADLFTLEGVEYYKRVGAAFNSVEDKYLCDELTPFLFEDKYDKVMYPINILDHSDVSQVDAAVWWLSQPEVQSGSVRTAVFLWAGNNDSSQAALGTGGANPTQFPLPYDQIKGELDSDVRSQISLAELLGLLETEPYSLNLIERGLTNTLDFDNQLEDILDRLQNAAGNAPVDFFVMNLPYYSSVGYLFDSEDLEFYLKQANSSYKLPFQFDRVAPAGQPITDYNAGDRVSFFTFGFMYLLLDSGYSVNHVNGALVKNWIPRTGAILNDSESSYIRQRIDQYNQKIAQQVNARGNRFHLVQIGDYLNDALTGQTSITINGRELTRKWTRGSGFSLDGVHPGYTGQALIANYILEHVDSVMGTNTGRYNLSSVFNSDPYVDQDGDGWAAGPSYAPSGITELLFFLTDADDTNPNVGPVVPNDAWSRVSAVLRAQLSGGAKRKAGNHDDLKGMMPVFKDMAVRAGLDPESAEFKNLVEQALDRAELDQKTKQSLYQ